MRPFRRAADRARLQELEAIIGEGTRLLKATPGTPTGQRGVAVDAAQKATLERLLILARNRPPNKSRKAR